MHGSSLRSFCSLSIAEQKCSAGHALATSVCQADCCAKQDMQPDAASAPWNITCFCSDTVYWPCCCNEAAAARLASYSLSMHQPGRGTDLDEGGEAPCASSHVYDLGRPRARAPAPHVFCHRHKRHPLHNPQQPCQVMGRGREGVIIRLELPSGCCALSSCLA